MKLRGRRLKPNWFNAKTADDDSIRIASRSTNAVASRATLQLRCR